MDKILIVGQTPPPYGGQALMIEYMLNFPLDSVRYYHVRMVFSKEMSERGKLSLYKIFHLFYIILNIYRLKFKHRIKYLYYPPSNSPQVAIFRDVIILFFTRFLFKKVIFHFHAAGISEELLKYSKLKQKIIYAVLKKPDVSITSSEFNPPDGKFLQSKQECIIPLGIPEIVSRDFEKKKNKIITLLFVGLLNSTKGEGYILEALKLLKEEGIEVNLNLAGKFENSEYKNSFFNKITEYKLTENVKYLGVITGDEKKNAFASADVFCFPSFFVAESFGIVLLEAMQFKLPIIATRWRGIQSIVKDSVNGYLVDIKNAEQISIAVKSFYYNRSLLKVMGEKSRLLYDDEYTINRYIQQIAVVFNNL